MLVEEDNLASVMTVLNHISPEQAVEMRHQVAFLWRNYFSSMRSITLATLQIINDRVFPYVSRTYEDWNDPPDMVTHITGGLITHITGGLMTHITGGLITRITEVS